ncbi:MAG: hypothetical protein IT512_02615, partial [Rhodocyclaceae bacterium]|nr:hypothetical protein [Rhodocyclaceae bacterium]
MKAPIQRVMSAAPSAALAAGAGRRAAFALIGGLATEAAPVGRRGTGAGQARPLFSTSAGFVSIRARFELAGGRQRRRRSLQGRGKAGRQARHAALAETLAFLGE